MILDCVVVWTAVGGTTDGRGIASILVNERLAACVNILPNMVSIYRWDGKLERGDEAVMIIKTRASLAVAVEAAVKQMHSYTTPAILVMPLESIEQSYFSWIMAETEAAQR